ncbi:MAG TPA: serine/threonine-protein kinase, partial [Chloroflexota bacterium]|nr:serine/threonine-protein kinase [Chloroflexota bacterium]
MSGASNASSGSGPSSDLVGRQIGNYRIDTLIGSGGMGKVYRAVHAHLGRPAAVKVIHDHLASDPGFKARFEREANTSASLNHPHIIKILDFGDQEGRAYLVMELATGGSLRTLLQRHASSGQPLAWQIGVPLVVQAADGLEYANARNTVHRDVKPDNLMLQAPEGPDGLPVPNPAADPLAYTVKICDFGLAQLRHDGRMTATGTTVGTPAYISPEQCQGLQVDGRSDLYSLGIVLYEVATGYLPFETKSLAEALYKHVNTPPPPPRGVRPDLPADLEAIILRCLAKRPEERYADCGQLAAALREAMARVTPMPGAAPSAERLLAAGSALVATEIPSDGP